MISTPTLLFLRELSENNNRDWFQEHKPRYEKAKQNLEGLVEALIREVGTFEALGNLAPKDCIFRINRDVRFSKDKKPYKEWMSAVIGNGGRKSQRIDYYIHIQPNNQSFLGSGMWAPTPEQLATFRQEIDYNAHEFKAIIEDPVFRSYFPDIEGEVLRTAPKGYPKDHPDIELLKRKQLFFMHRFDDSTVTSPTFVAELVSAIRVVKPFGDWLNTLFFED
jgi:uncharacterized protein (TIGR02453 family)